VLASWRPQAARSADALTSADLGGYGYGSYGYGYGGYGTYGGSSNNDPATVTPPANTVPYSFHIRFVGMDCGALLGDAAKLLAFKFNVRSAVAKAAGLNVANFRVGNVSCGSVVRERAAIGGAALRLITVLFLLQIPHVAVVFLPTKLLLL
jgi:hypothetical protein